MILVQICQHMFTPLFMASFQDSKGRCPRILPSIAQMPLKNIVNPPTPVPWQEVEICLPRTTEHTPD